MSDPDASPESRALADALLEVFERQNPDGTFYFTDADVRAFLPYVVLRAGGLHDRSRWSPALGRILDDFCAGLGLAADAPAEQLHAAAARHFDRQPLNGELLRSFQRFLSESAPDPEPA